MIRRIDAWVGLRLFHPPIIWVCQRAGMTQWAFYRYAWWIAALWCVWDDDRSSTVWTVLLVGGALIRTMSAGLHINRPARSLRLLRYGGLFAALLIVGFGAARQYSAAEFADQMGWDILMLAAEYAATIRTIPPRKKREPVQRSREALA
jgi:hypothetical protein